MLKLFFLYAANHRSTHGCCLSVSLCACARGGYCICFWAKVNVCMCGCSTVPLYTCIYMCARLDIRTKHQQFLTVALKPKFVLRFSHSQHTNADCERHTWFSIVFVYGMPVANNVAVSSSPMTFSLCANVYLIYIYMCARKVGFTSSHVISRLNPCAAYRSHFKWNQNLMSSYRVSHENTRYIWIYISHS